MTEPATPTDDSRRIDSFLAQLADRQPMPGGGAVVALSAALGAALLAMVAGSTTGGRYVEVEDEMRAYVAELAKLRGRALAAMEEDNAASAAVGAAYAMAKETEEEEAVRSAAIEAAFVAATGPPQTVSRICERLAVIAEVLATKGSDSTLADVGVGAACVAAALDGAALNVAINAAQVSDAAVVSSLTVALRQMDEVTERLAAVVDDVRREVSH